MFEHCNINHFVQNVVYNLDVFGCMSLAASVTASVTGYCRWYTFGEEANRPFAHFQSLRSLVEPKATGPSSIRDMLKTCYLDLHMY